MTKDELKLLCTIDSDDEDCEMGIPNKKMIYKNQVVIGIDFTNDMVMTAQSSERMGEYDMKSTDWNDVGVYKRIS